MLARAQQAPAAVPTGGVIQAINVSGNHRIDTSTIIAYMVVQVGDQFDPQRINQSLKTLYATGLFKSVNITRDGNNLDVAVVENPTVNQVLFSGNKTVEDKDAQAGDQPEAPLGVHPRGGRGGPPSYPRLVRQEGLLQRRPSPRRSSSCRTTA